MCRYTDRQAQEKRLFYSRPEVSGRYDRLRFGGPSGEWVNQRELNVVKSLLPSGGRILDLGCGTGRLSLHLGDLGYDVVGLDRSSEMLSVARAKPSSKDIAWLCGDAFAVPLASAAFDAVVALRLAFHFADLQALLASAIRPARPHGTIVLDTYNWSPRTRASLGRRTWGSRIFAHHPDRVKRVATDFGLEVVKTRGCFLFSPYVYRLLPLPVTRALGRLEALVPDRLKARTFWHLRSPGHPVCDDRDRLSQNA